MDYHIKIYKSMLLIGVLTTFLFIHSDAFNVGISGTKCNLDPAKGEISDSCGSLYDAICVVNKCKCPPGFSEDKALKRCKKGAGSGSSGGAFEDLPFDFDPNNKADKKPDVEFGGFGGRQPPYNPNQPGYNPNQPGYNPNQPGYNPNQPGYNPNQPGYNPNQPGYNPNQPGYNPNQPGYNPNQPGYNPNQPGYNPNQPGYNPNQPGYNPNRPGYNPNKPRGGGGDPHMGEKAGGGAGGVMGLLLIGALIYFCCFRGKNKARGQTFMSRIPGMGNRFQPPQNRGGDMGPAAYPMNDPHFIPNNPNMQPQYAPAPQAGPPGVPMPGQQPPPPIGFYPGNDPNAPQQPPPPYSQQYQPGV